MRCSASARWAPLGLLILLLVQPSSSVAQLVESSLTVRLTAKATIYGSGGARMIPLRVGTRDIIEGIKQDRGIVRAGGRLVTRRDIADLELASAEDFLVVDGFLYSWGTPFLATPGLDLPESFYGFAESFTRPAGDGSMLSFERERTTSATGDLATFGNRFTLVGLDRRSGRLAISSRGSELGYLYRSLSATVFGGLEVPEVPELRGQILLVTGTISNGPEKFLGFRGRSD